MEKLIILLCTFFSQQLISQTIIVDSDKTELLAGNLQFLRDSSGDLSFEEIREKIKNEDLVDPGSVCHLSYNKNRHTTNSEMN